MHIAPQQADDARTHFSVARFSLLSGSLYNNNNNNNCCTIRVADWIHRRPRPKPNAHFVCCASFNESNRTGHMMPGSFSHFSPFGPLFENCEKEERKKKESQNCSKFENLDLLWTHRTLGGCVAILKPIVHVMRIGDKKRSRTNKKKKIEKKSDAQATFCALCVSAVLRQLKAPRSEP